MMTPMWRCNMRESLQGRLTRFKRRFQMRLSTCWHWEMESVLVTWLNIYTEVAVLVYNVLHGCAPSFLGPFTYVADLPSCRGIRSSCSDCLVQPPVHRCTVGSRAFLVAGPQMWNCLPPEVTSAPFKATFRTRLETFLFTESYPDIRLI